MFLSGLRPCLTVVMVVSLQVLLQKSEVESVLHSPGDYILLSADKYEIKVGGAGAGLPPGPRAEAAAVSWQVWPLGREINCKCLRTLSVSEDRSISLQPRLQFDGRYIVCSSDLGVYQWDFSSFEILRQVFPFTRPTHATPTRAAVLMMVANGDSRLLAPPGGLEASAHQPVILPVGWGGVGWRMLLEFHVNSC